MPKPTSQPVKAQQPTAQNPPVLGWVIVLAFIAFAVWSWKATNHGDQQQDKQQDQKQVIDQGDKQPPKPDNNPGLKDCILITVVDKKSVNESVDYTITLQNDKFWKELAPTLVKNIEHLEDDDDVGKKALFSRQRNRLAS